MSLKPSGLGVGRTFCSYFQSHSCFIFSLKTFFSFWRFFGGGRQTGEEVG